MFRLLCLLIAFDISGDYIFFPRSDFVTFNGILIRYFTIFVILLIYIENYILKLFNLNGKIKSTDGVLNIFIIIFIYGFFRGLLNDSLLINCLNEILPFSMIFIIPYLIDKKIEILEKDILFFFDCMFYFLIIKIIICQYNHFLTYNSFSWKILLKMSVLYIAPFYYFSIKYMSEKKYIYLIKSLLFIVGIFIANSRALIILNSLLLLYIIMFKKIKDKLLLYILILVGSLISSFITDIDYFHIFGFWDNSAFQSTVSYRLIQFDLLVERFIEHPIAGYGFGYYNNYYESYGTLEKPYLLELDLINFASKIGIPLFILYIIIYYKLLYKIIYKSNFYSSLLLESLSINVLCLLIYSLSQTGHSSYTFWFLFSLFYSLFKKNNFLNK